MILMTTWCMGARALNSLVDYFNVETYDTHEVIVTTRTNIWIVHIHSLGFQVIREGVTLRRVTLRNASHYGRISRGRRFSPIRLQETKNSAGQSLTLEAKVQRLSLSKMPTWQYFFTKVTESQRKFGSDMNGYPHYGWEAIDLFSYKNKILTRSWPLDWRAILSRE
jgi:hypothetical protein